MKNLNLPASIVEALNLLDNADCGLAYKAIYAYLNSRGVEPTDLPGNIRCILALIRPQLDRIVKRLKAADQRELDRSKAPVDPSIPERDLQKAREIVDEAFRKWKDDFPKVKIRVRGNFELKMDENRYSDLIPYPDGDFRLIRRE